MARLVGTADITPEDYPKLWSLSENHGVKLSTEGILEGIEKLAKELDEHPENNWMTSAIGLAAQNEKKKD